MQLFIFSKRDGLVAGDTAGLGSIAGVTAGVGAEGESGDRGSPHKSARSSQAWVTPSWFSKNGTVSQSYLYKIFLTGAGKLTIS